MRITSLILISFWLTTQALAGPISYQGQLQQQDQPFSGTTNLEFRLFDAASAGSQIGPVQTRDGVGVQDGLFQVELDFGVGAFDGSARFLEVRVNGTPLTPRQAVTAAPVALYALAGNEGPTGPQGPAGEPAADGWRLDGNAGTSSATNFIGTTDNQALELRTANVRSLRIEPSAELFGGLPITANVIAGSHRNAITPGVRGGTIAGGGTMGNVDPVFSIGEPNRVSAHYGTVGGGTYNQAGAGTDGIEGGFATVGGGIGNFATGDGSTVVGGLFNYASGDYATVSGRANTASGANSAVGGGLLNCAGGDQSWAGGTNAKVRPGLSSGTPGFGCSGVATTEGGDQGTFVWADSQNENFVSTGPNQFLVRAFGGVGVNSAAPAAHLHVQRTTGFSDIALFASTSGANVRLASGESSSSILIFSDPNGLRASLTAFAGSTFTLRSNGALQMRTGGNVTRFHLTEDGGISIRRGPGGPDPDKAIQVGNSETTGNGAHLTNTGVWTSASSRSFKHGFEALDPLAVLERVVNLPVMRWSYQGQDEVRHIGPTAEDFHDAFGLGSDDRYIGAVDADGVALAAIQGLNAKLEADNVVLREEMASLRAQMDELRALLGAAPQGAR